MHSGYTKTTYQYILQPGSPVSNVLLPGADGEERKIEHKNVLFKNTSTLHILTETWSTVFRYPH